MKIKKSGLIIVLVVMIITFYGGAALADKSATAIEAPDQVAEGAEITVKIHVTHRGNSFAHYTNWVKVLVDGNEVALWQYSANNRPENAKFTREIKLIINKSTEIVAESSCNLHGGDKPSKKTITLK
ncbi:MAG: hypothetical protein JXB42_00970 [Deltaproteobacteria bacterium]|nr:hypothetical protein [Deltaproteobacteria bacterium]